jgi:fructose/tagatose bisphosphate aldolase
MPELRRYSRLHLDHIPVIDEDGNEADYRAIINRALSCGYESVMIDGSRLDLAGNIEATAWVCKTAHAAGVPVEGELGAVLGHEEGPLPPYEELFSSGRGFTDPDEAARFVNETGVDWLSIAFGNIHGAITPEERKKKKIAARLDIEHLKTIRRKTGLPIVLHGGSGIRTEYVLEAVENGVVKINVASDIRRAYEAAMEDSEDNMKAAVIAAVKKVIDEFEITGSAVQLMD